MVKRECCKCGSDDIEVAYGHSYMGGEFLDCTCRECGYVWRADCLDKKQVVSQSFTMPNPDSFTIT